MATKLDKTVTRESTNEVDGRNILVSITEDQKISMKLKGMKSGIVEIPIENLYNQLIGNQSEIKNEEDSETKKTEPVVFNNSEKKQNGEPLLNLHDFRSAYLTSGDIPLEYKIKLEAITVRLIEQFKNRKK